jgi:MFS family permease
MSIQPVTMAIFSVVFGGMSDKIEPRILSSIGILLTFIALAILSNLTSASSLVAFVLALILAGLGFGLFASPNTNAIMSSVDKSDYGTASGAVATTRMLGQLTSMVLVAFLMSLVIGDQFIGASSLPLLEKLIKLSFGCAAVICIPGIILSLSRGEKKVVT